MIKTFGHVESFYYLTSGLKRRREDRHRLFKNGHEKTCHQSVTRPKQTKQHKDYEQQLALTYWTQTNDPYVKRSALSTELMRRKKVV